MPLMEDNPSPGPSLRFGSDLSRKGEVKYRPDGLLSFTHPA